MRAGEPTSQRHSFQTMSGTIQKDQGMHQGLRRASAEPTAHPTPPQAGLLDLAPTAEGAQGLHPADPALRGSMCLHVMG